jgi:thioredoxin 1
MSDIVSEVTDQTFDSEVVQSSLPVLVDFWAVWCGPCRALAPTMDAIAEKYQGKIKVVKLNVDDNPRSASRYKIKGIPTLLFFVGGQVVEQVVGVASQEKISELIDTRL